VAAISAGGNAFTVAVKTDGSVWVWGNNYGYALGDGTEDSSETPVQVRVDSGAQDNRGTPFLSGVTQVAAGWVGTIALKSDGTVWLWGGRDDYGRLTPWHTGATRIAGLNRIVDIPANEANWIALDADGRVWTWGDNFWGQLGDGTTEDRSNPVMVEALTDVVAISANEQFSAAVTANGAVWTWGDRNISGGPARSPITQESLTPRRVEGISGVVGIAAGSENLSAYLVMLKGDGSVWVLGSVYGGAVLEGNSNRATRPVQITGISDVQAIAAAGGRTVALKGDGSVWVWGDR